MRTFAIILSLCTLLCATAGAWAEPANPGFETDEDTCDGTHQYPSSYGDWHGDESNIVVAENGITPFGDRMLRFLGTTPNGGHSQAVACQVWQFIDVSGYSELIASGDAVAAASYYVNRVPGDAQTDTLFGIRLSSHTGAIGQFPGNEIDYVSASISSDGSTATWELVSTEPLELATTTTYLTVEIIASENICNDSSNELDGHYADNCNLEIVPEPATLLLLALGGAGVLSRRRAVRRQRKPRDG